MQVTAIMLKVPPDLYFEKLKQRSLRNCTVDIHIPTNKIIQVLTFCYICFDIYLAINQPILFL